MRYCLFFKLKTAYEMRISDWSSDVCSSDLPDRLPSRLDGGEAVERLALDLHGARIALAAPVVAVGIEGGADLRLDRLALRREDVATQVQPVDRKSVV